MFKDSILVFTFGDIVGIVILCVTILPLLILLLIEESKRIWKQYNCEHEKYKFYEKINHQTLSRDAICLNCGKNLGYIETVREKRGELEAMRF